jgi:hypothetical protein
MKLTDFLLPVNNDNETMHPNRLFDGIFEAEAPFDGFKSPGVALVSGHTALCDRVRNCLRKLPSHFKNIKMYDLGYLKTTDAVHIENIMSLCAEKGVVPVFTGLESALNDVKEDKFGRFIVHNRILQPCRETNHIAYQRHLCALDDIYHAEEYLYNALSLGKLRTNPAILEPSLRDVRHLFVDLKAVRKADAPNVTGTYPTGLQAEELCQILKHTGTGSNVQAVFLMADVSADLCEPEAQLMAEAVWYFAEGINIRINDHPTKSTDHTKFIIHSAYLKEDLEFYKHNQTGKWWVKHPETMLPSRYLACSYEEYQASLGEDLPERIGKFCMMHELDT